MKAAAVEHSGECRCGPMDGARPLVRTCTRQVSARANLLFQPHYINISEKNTTLFIKVYNYIHQRFQWFTGLDYQAA
jgi:hypothetical protein